MGATQLLGNFSLFDWSYGKCMHCVAMIVLHINNKLLNLNIVLYVHIGHACLFQLNIVVTCMHAKRSIR